MQRPRSQATLSENLKQVLLKEDKTSVSVADILHAVGDKGFGLLFVVLSLPSALPVPAPGYSTPFGIIIALLGIQLIAGKREPVLPKRACKLSLKYSSAEKMLTKASWFFQKVEPFIHPRFNWLRSRGGEAFMGILLTLMAGLMILPIPLTNTAPAMVIFLIGCGLSEDDGLFVLGACVLGALATCLYTVVLYYFVLYGVEGVFYLKDKLIEFLKTLT
tara:strand:- start:3740 stop:4393 length:654 start_codon:yes stop_codon:yes gene_type:complete